MDENIDIMPDQVEAPKLNPTEEALENLESDLGKNIDRELDEKEVEVLVKDMDMGLERELDQMSKDEDPEVASHAKLGKKVLANVKEMQQELYSAVEEEDKEKVANMLKEYKATYQSNVVESGFSPEKQTELTTSMNEYLDLFVQVCEEAQDEANAAWKAAVFGMGFIPVFGDALSCVNGLRGVTLDGEHLNGKERLFEFGMGAFSLGFGALTAGGGSAVISGGKATAYAAKYAAKYGDEAVDLVHGVAKYGDDVVTKIDDALELKEHMYDKPKEIFEGGKIAAKGARQLKNHVTGDGKVNFQKLMELKEKRDAAFSAMLSA